MKIEHVAVACSSEERADRFFTGILGLEKIKFADLPEELMDKIFDRKTSCRFITYGDERAKFEVFISGPSEGGNRGFEHTCIVVPGRKEFAGRCKAAGLEIRWVPKGEALLLFVKDFDGNLFEVKEASGAGE